MISPSIIDPIELIKYRNHLRDTIGKEYENDVRISNEQSNELFKHDEHKYIEQ